MQKAMWRQKELKSLQNVALVDERIPCQMTADPSSIHTSGLYCWHIRHSLNFPARPLGRITVIDKLGLAPACRLLHTITTQHEEPGPGHNMFAAVCRSQLLQMHFLWLSAVVVRGLKLKFKWCVRVSPVSVWASRALGTKPKLYPGHSQPSPPPYSCLYTHNMKCYGDFKIIMFFHKHSIHLTYLKWSILHVFYVLDILQ